MTDTEFKEACELIEDMVEPAPAPPPPPPGV
jgi:hypothetical protein